MNIEECGPLQAVLAAFARGTKRSRLRLLAVVCPSGHTLAEVFPTEAGPYVIAQERRRWELIDGKTVEHKPPQLTWQAEPVGVDSDGWATDISVVCRCTEATIVRGADLLGWLNEGRKRVVVDA